MPTLIIQSRTKNSNISIQLRPGQTCVIGSSPIADYCVEDPNISIIHCRVYHNTSGGFIECFDAAEAIAINDKLKNRSRLAPGDRLTIGIATFDVELRRLDRMNRDSARDESSAYFSEYGKLFGDFNEATDTVDIDNMDLEIDFEMFNPIDN